MDWGCDTLLDSSGGGGNSHQQSAHNSIQLTEHAFWSVYRPVSPGTWPVPFQTPEGLVK